MRIGILGTRGIPNQYGGFEQFAQYLSLGLVQRGHEVFVYNSSLHSYQEVIFKKVNLIHCRDFENKIGTAGQFIYDLNCILDSRKREFDIILQLGYTSNSVWGWLLPQKPIIITNMDGLEWKRSKFNIPTQKFLKQAEKWAVKRSNHLIADSLGIQKHIKTSYNKNATYIAYGSEVFSNPNPNILSEYNLAPCKYFMLVARIEPENNIETILDGFVLSNSSKPFIVVGKMENSYAKYLKNKFQNHPLIKFIGGVYDRNKLDNLRFHCQLYFHGHSVGGTNPSLLEAMASSAFIVAHQNIFNSSILGKDSLYFRSKEDIANIINQEISEKVKTDNVSNNKKKIKEDFSWQRIISSYEDLFVTLATSKDKLSV